MDHAICTLNQVRRVSLLNDLGSMHWKWISIFVCLDVSAALVMQYNHTDLHRAAGTSINVHKSFNQSMSVHTQICTLCTWIDQSVHIKYTYKSVVMHIIHIYLYIRYAHQVSTSDLHIRSPHHADQHIRFAHQICTLGMLIMQVSTSYRSVHQMCSSCRSAHHHTDQYIRSAHQTR